MYVTTIQRLNYSEQESEKQFAVYDSDSPVILKQGQSHQNWYESVEPSKVIIMHNLKNLTWSESVREPAIKFLSKQETRQLLHLSGSFMCHCGNTGVETDAEWKPSQKVNSEEQNSSPTLAGLELLPFDHKSVAVPTSYPGALRECVLQWYRRLIDYWLRRWGDLLICWFSWSVLSRKEKKKKKRKEKPNTKWTILDFFSTSTIQPSFPTWTKGRVKALRVSEAAMLLELK